MQLPDLLRTWWGWGWGRRLRAACSRPTLILEAAAWPAWTLLPHGSCWPRCRLRAARRALAGFSFSCEVRCLLASGPGSGVRGVQDAATCVTRQKTWQGSGRAPLSRPQRSPPLLHGISGVRPSIPGCGK